jgi:DnaJ-class molecular chaperone
MSKEGKRGTGRKGECRMNNRFKDQEECPYCNGQGYFQLLLGGTENCPNCEGLGTCYPDSKEPAVTGSGK